jgi:GNAT superfamily N-acetyltransferase
MQSRNDRPTQPIVNLRFEWDERHRAEAAAFASRAFLASPDFAGVDESRYTPQEIETSMARGRLITAWQAHDLVGCAVLFAPNRASPCETFRTHSSFGLLASAPGQGIGGLILNELEQISPLALSVTQRSTFLVNFYEKRGYGRVAEFHWPGARDLSWIMIKP